MMSRFFRRLKPHVFVLFSILLIFTGCEKHEPIANNVHEREANVIIVLLATKGIDAMKVPITSTGAGAGAATQTMYNITVAPNKTVEAMAILNQNGLPRIQGTNLLELFAKQGLMTSEMEEQIRYHAGLAEELSNTIRKIDGVIDADVQLSFPPPETGIPGMGPEQKTTASVFVKHQGIIDDPNSHLVTKIKLLVSGSIGSLDINDVTVISDRSRFTDISLNDMMEPLGKGSEDQYVSIWSVMMNQASAGRFRFIMLTLSLLTLVFALIIGWMVWKFYPILRKKGLKELLKTAPITNGKRSKEEGMPPPEGM